MQVLLTSLIDDFIQSVKDHDDYAVTSAKFTKLSKFMGPSEMHGLREAWAFSEGNDQAVLPWALDDTVNFLRERFKNVKVFVN